MLEVSARSLFLFTVLYAILNEKYATGRSAALVWGYCTPVQSLGPDTTFAHLSFTGRHTRPGNAPRTSSRSRLLNVIA